MLFNIVPGFSVNNEGLLVSMLKYVLLSIFNDFEVVFIFSIILSVSKLSKYAFFMRNFLM